MEPKFLKWLNAVCPSEAVAYRLTVSIDWNTVLEILLAIFKLLAMFGCLAARRYSAQVKKVLSTYANSPTKSPREVALCTARLMEIRDEMERNIKEKRMFKSLFLLLAILPSLLFAKGGVQVDFKGRQYLYSPKLQKRFYLGLKAHATTTEQPDTKYLTADVKVPNDFVLTDKYPLPAGLPYDQGQCGSCVVNSINGQATYALSIRGKLPAGVLSRGQTMNCNPTAGQCDGDWAENVGGWVGARGHLLSELVYPYRASSGSCRNITGTEYGEIPKGRVVDNSSESIGKMLVVGIPPSTTVGADNSWMNADSSLYTACTRQGTNHEVLIIGIHARGAARGTDGFINFAAAKPGDIVLDILNSWGGRWCDAGVIHTVQFDSRGNRCNNVTEEVYAFDWEPVLPEPAVSCTVEVAPKSVAYGDSVSLTITSVNAKSALGNGQTVAVPKGSVTEVAAPGGALPQTVAVRAFAAGSDGKQVACTGDTSYTVTAAPVPPTPTPGSFPWYVWALGALVAIAVAYFVGKKSQSHLG